MTETQEHTELDVDLSISPVCEFLRRREQVQCVNAATWRLTWRCLPVDHLILACDEHKESAVRNSQTHFCKRHKVDAVLIQVEPL